MHYVFGSSVRPLSANTYFAWRDISVFSGGISMKLRTNIHQVSGHCRKGFQGRRSKVKVIGDKNTFRHCGIKDHLFVFSLLSFLQQTSKPCNYILYLFTFLCIVRSISFFERYVLSQGWNITTMMYRASWIPNTTRSRRRARRQGWTTRKRCWCTAELNEPRSRWADWRARSTALWRSWNASNAPRASAAKRWASCWKILPRYVFMVCFRKWVIDDRL